VRGDATNSLPCGLDRHGMPFVLTDLSIVGVFEQHRVVAQNCEMSHKGFARNYVVSDPSAFIVQRLIGKKINLFK
jgi:hypothetical protein